MKKRDIFLIHGTDYKEMTKQLLERANLACVDRSTPRRYTVLQNQLRKAGRLDLLAEDMDYRTWERL